MRIVSKNKKSSPDLVFSYCKDIRKAGDAQAVLSTLSTAIHQIASTEKSYIFVFNPTSNSYTSFQDGPSGSDLRFSADSPLAKFLVNSPDAVLIDNPSSLPPSLEKEQVHLAVLDPKLIIPIQGFARLVGWVMVGSKKTGGPYQSTEIQAITLLCTLAAQLIEKYEDIASSEKESQEMAALIEISKGISITRSFDDAVELVYTRVQEIIPFQNFQILICDTPSATSRYVFYVVDKQRFGNLENQPLATSTLLAEEVFRNQNAILTDDYQQECRIRGLIPTQTDVYAWIGVPLNIGSSTFGVLEIGNRDESATYSVEQLNLLQAIANQVAGAILKARLLDETGQRARQLGILNEAARQFSSTLELLPLMQMILKIALELSYSESGMVALVEVPAGQIVTQVVAGQCPPAQVGKQVLYEPMLVSQLMRGCEPVILNGDPASYNQFFNESDRWPDFQTRMIVPLVVKERLIGIIDLFNKLDNRKFDHDDQALMQVFASQAAIALEMTQSYIKTDLALAARVEELSVMQQIDRELNTSLEIEKAMGITLDWAMRQSKAGAGLIGLVEENGIQVMSSRGYSNELAPFVNSVIPPDALPVQKLLQNNQPVILKLTSKSNTQTKLLEDCRSQIIVPILRESGMIGIILLESRQPDFWSNDDLAFLTRLGDHASVAIFNAQLYHVVQDANNAKSEFVSFVAHELKNPMTSIKGYTELLAAGAVGPVSVPQANFLSTIRSNIDRMNTLISELNDLSKIEAGRLHLEFKAFRISEVVEEAVRSARRQIEEKSQGLSIEISPDLPPIWADRTRMIQILVNLISNANKYTPREGQILVSASINENLEGEADFQKNLHLWVKDDGIGISEDDQKRIFQKFFRSEDPKTRETSGTGLGLNITRSLVEMQGGRIWFESKFREGTTFHITIPIAS